MTLYRIVETDNFGSDYPDEKFLNIPPWPHKSEIEAIAAIINSIFCHHPESTRFWKVVEAGYKLQPGFEP